MLLICYKLFFPFSSNYVNFLWSILNIIIILSNNYKKLCIYLILFPIVMKFSHKIIKQRFCTFLLSMQLLCMYNGYTFWKGMHHDELFADKAKNRDRTRSFKQTRTLSCKPQTKLIITHKKMYVIKLVIVLKCIYRQLISDVHYSCCPDIKQSPFPLSAHITHKYQFRQIHIIIWRRCLSHYTPHNFVISKWLPFKNSG